MRLFEVKGCPDGTSTVNLLTGRDNIELSLPGALNLNGPGTEFFLESLGPPDAVFPGRRPPAPRAFGVEIAQERRGGVEVRILPVGAAPYGGVPSRGLPGGVVFAGRAQTGESSTSGGEGSSDLGRGASNTGDASRTYVYGEGFPRLLPERGAAVRNEDRGQFLRQRGPPVLVNRRAANIDTLRASGSGSNPDPDPSSDQVLRTLDLATVGGRNQGRVSEEGSASGGRVENRVSSLTAVDDGPLRGRAGAENRVGGGSALTAEEARRQYLLRVHLRQQQLMRNLWLGNASNPELQQLEAALSSRAQGETPGEMRRHAYEYLLRLANTPRGSSGEFVTFLLVMIM
jgi:hypothetical protein